MKSKTSEQEENDETHSCPEQAPASLKEEESKSYEKSEKESDNSEDEEQTE